MTSSKTRTTVVATSSPRGGDCETVSRSYQAQVLGITIFAVVGIVVFIKYVCTKYFAQLELEHPQPHQYTEF